MQCYITATLPCIPYRYRLSEPINRLPHNTALDTWTGNNSRRRCLFSSPHLSTVVLMRCRPNQHWQSTLLAVLACMSRTLSCQTQHSNGSCRMHSWQQHAHWQRYTAGASCCIYVPGPVDTATLLPQQPRLGSHRLDRLGSCAAPQALHSVPQCTLIHNTVNSLNQRTHQQPETAAAARAAQAHNLYCCNDAHQP